MPDDARPEVSAARELAELFPAPKSVVIAGRNVEIARCGIAQAGRIIDAGLPLYLATGGEIDLLPLFEERPKEVAAVLVAATELDAEWVGNLEPDDALELALAWMEVNGAFFVHRRLRQVTRLVAAMAAMRGAGPISSIPSSDTGTPTPAVTPHRPPAGILPPSTAPSDERAGSE